MNTIALRYGEFFSPKCGTISAHQQIIDDIGFVWYGKLGNRLSKNAILDIMNNENPRILLINSGKSDRYWAYVTEISFDVPDINCIPEYYRNARDKFSTWFKINSFEKASKDVMSKCIVSSSKMKLGEVSKHSLSPYYKIEYIED